MAETQMYVQEGSAYIKLKFSVLLWSCYLEHWGAFPSYSLLHNVLHYGGASLCCVLSPKLNTEFLENKR